MGEIDKGVRAAMLVPDSTKTNYAEDIRRSAVARGISVAEAKLAKVNQWRKQHEDDVLAGWNVLADWLEGNAGDLSEFLDHIDPVEAAKVRALESAKRDPQQAGAAILNHDDPEIRAEIDAAHRQNSTTAAPPVVTDAGDEVPADQVDAALAGKTPAKKTAAAKVS